MQGNDLDENELHNCLFLITDLFEDIMNAEMTAYVPTIALSPEYELATAIYYLCRYANLQNTNPHSNFASKKPFALFRHILFCTIFQVLSESFQGFDKTRNNRLNAR